MSQVNSGNNQDVLDRWFVQIKGQIVGPMSGEKILARVISDELTVMSRVSQDRKSWKAICNVSFFEELVNSRIRTYTGKTEVVGQMRVGGDNTLFETSEFNFNTLDAKATDGISEQLDHARQLEELTANIQKLNTIKKELILKRKSIVVEKESNDDEGHPEDQNVFIPKPSKKFSFKEMFSGNVRHRKLAIASVILVVGGLAGTVAYQSHQSQLEQEALAVKMKNEADALAKVDYDKAKTSMGGTNLTKNATADELLAIAETHLKAGNPKAGHAAIQQALKMNLNSSNRARAHAMAAEFSIASGDFDQAAIEYSQSLQHVELFSTLHGAGVLNLKRGNPEDAERLFLKALQLPTANSADRVVTLLNLFESAFAIDKKARADHKAKASQDPEPAMAKTAAALNLINEALKNNTVGRDRLLLARAMSEYYIGNKEAFQVAAIELIDEPTKEESAKLETELESEMAQWSFLVRHCATVYNQPPISGFGAAFYASCLSRSHGPAQALPFAKYAFSVNGKDPIFGSLNAFIHFENGDIEQANKILTANPNFADSSKLARALLEKLANRRLPSGSSTSTPGASPQQ